MLPLVSVIIALYNKESYIARAIESVLAQTYKRYEIIVIDDESSDGSRIALEPYMERITYLWQHNAGASAARNRGIRESSGQYIAFLDADDYWLEGFLEHTVSFLEQHSDISAVGTAFWREREKGKLWQPAEKGSLPEGSVEDFFKTYAETRFCSTSSVLIRGKVLDLVGGVRTDLMTGEDVELWCRVGAIGKWGYIRKALATYDQTDTGSLTRGRDRVSRMPDFSNWEREILPLLTPAQEASYQRVRWMILSDQVKRFIGMGAFERCRTQARAYKDEFGFAQKMLLGFLAISPITVLRILQLGYHGWLRSKRCKIWRRPVLLKLDQSGVENRSRKGVNSHEEE